MNATEAPTADRLRATLAEVEAALPEVEAALAAATARVEVAERTYREAGRARALAGNQQPKRPGDLERISAEVRAAEGEFTVADERLLKALSARAQVSARRDALCQRARRLEAALR